MITLTIIKFIDFLVLIVSILINIAFLSLFQRKIFGLIQIRRGPNKLGIIGFIQPFSDAIKLFSKELIIPKKSRGINFKFSPILMFFLGIII